MTRSQSQLARLHPVWLWFFICGGIVLLSEVTGAGMLDGGLGSLLFGVLLILGAPLFILGKIVIVATSWAPQWLQTVTVIVVVVGSTAVADYYVTRWLRDNEAPEPGLPPN